MSERPTLPEAVRAALPAEAAAYIAALEAAVGALMARVTELEARLGQTSANSSRPPSSDPLGRATPAAPPSGRRPGGQPGHPGRFRALLDAERVDAIIVCVPEQCAACGAALPATAAPTDPVDERRQVLELPPVAAIVTE